MRHRNPNRQRRMRCRGSGRAGRGAGDDAGGTSAFAQSAAEDEDVPLDTKLMRQFLKDLGLRRDGEGIEYRERAPLVVPPSRNLPPPQSEAAVTANPAWPKDPDVAAAQGRGREEEAAQPDRGRDHGSRRTAAVPRRTRPRQGRRRNQRQRGQSAESGRERARRCGRPSSAPRAFSVTSFRLSAIRRKPGPSPASRPGEPDRAAARLSDAVAGPALWTRSEERKGQGSDGRRPRRGNSLNDGDRRRRSGVPVRAPPFAARPVPWRVRRAQDCGLCDRW